MSEREYIIIRYTSRPFRHIQYYLRQYYSFSFNNTLWQFKEYFNSSYKVCFKSSQNFSKGAQPVAPPIYKYARLKGPCFIDILPKFHAIWII